MLREVPNVRQHSGEPHRRWFKDAVLDLYVWSDAAGSISKFQLCYRFGAHEYALIWSAVEGCVHARVDEGEQVPSRNATPILTADGPIPARAVSTLFEAAGAELPAQIYAFVARQLARL